MRTDRYESDVIKAAVYKEIRDLGKMPGMTESPLWEVLHACCVLGMNLSVIAKAMGVTPQYVAQWYRLRFPITETYHEPLIALLEKYIDGAVMATDRAEAEGSYPLRDINQYRERIAYAEGILDKHAEDARQRQNKNSVKREKPLRRTKLKKRRVN